MPATNFAPARALRASIDSSIGLTAWTLKSFDLVVAYLANKRLSLDTLATH
jgi:hypothetical protein